MLTVLFNKVASELINIARGPTWILPHVFSADGAVQRQCEPPTPPLLIIIRNAPAMTQVLIHI